LLLLLIINGFYLSSLMIVFIEIYLFDQKIEECCIFASL